MAIGRTVLTKEIQRKIVRYLEQGQNYSTAVALVGVNEITASQWLLQGTGGGQWRGKVLRPLFVQYAEAVECAIKKAQAESVKIIRKAASGDHPKNDPPSKTTTTTEYVYAYTCRDEKCGAAMPEGFKGVQCPLCRSPLKRVRAISNVKVAEEHRGSQWTAAAWYLERTDPKKFGHIERDKVPDGTPSGRLSELLSVLRQGQASEAKKGSDASDVLNKGTPMKDDGKNDDEES